MANYVIDAKYTSSPAPTFCSDYYSNIKSVYLSDQLSKRYGEKLEGANLSLPACMTADAESILQRVYSLGAKPSIVIFCAAPRDFMDNIVGEHNYHSFAATQFQWLEELSTTPSQTALDKAFGRIWHLYEIRHDYQYILQLAAASVRQNSSDKNRFKELFVAHKVDEPIQETRMKHHTDDYIARYQPFNKKLLNTELDHLHNLAELCQEHDTTLYVVNMPITQDNMALMPKDFYAQCLNGIRSVCEKNDAHLSTCRESHSIKNQISETRYIYAHPERKNHSKF